MKDVNKGEAQKKKETSRKPLGFKLFKQTLGREERTKGGKEGRVGGRKGGQKEGKKGGRQGGISYSITKLIMKKKRHKILKKQ